MNLPISIRFRAWLALAIAVLLPATAANAQTNSAESLVVGENTFACDLYSRLKASDGNLFFSPYSIFSCIGMAYTGARGDTARQMAAVMHFDESPILSLSVIAVLDNRLDKLRAFGITIQSANGVWAQTGTPLLPTFRQTLEQTFSARVSQVNFAESARVSAEINDWVSQKTMGKITDLIEPGALNADTDMVLVNAVYFKGQWLHRFDKESDTNATFSVTPDKKVRVTMMHQKGYVLRADTGDLQVALLPYALNRSASWKDGLSMVILLPRSVDGLKQLEKSLNASALQEWLRGTHSADTDLYLPRFTMKIEFDLSKTLAAMGMAGAFSHHADFSGMDGRKQLYISEVVHQAYVDVNEQGTEAAAATGAVVTHALDGVAYDFRADHPFIFLIRDNYTGNILFLGRVIDPTK